MDVSIIIPTLNRSDHIIKMIRYFNTVDFKGHLLIGDSSAVEHIERVKSAIKELKPKFLIIYREYPQLRNFECVRRLLQEVVTHYAICMGDDDILIPSALERAANFLDQHPEYSGAGGIIIQYQLKNIGAYGEVDYVGRYMVNDLEEESGSGRLLDQLRDYTGILFSLQHTEQLKERFFNIEHLTELTFASELLPTCMLAIQGKVKMLDQLFVVRQIQKNNYALANAFDWITNPDWQSSYQIFAKTLAQALVEQDAISFEKAMEIVKQVFWCHLSKYLSRSLNIHLQRFYQIPQSPNAISKAKSIIKNIPGAMRLRHTIQSFQTNSISLPSLLNPRSPYHNDFIPIYRATVSPSPKVKF